MSERVLHKEVSIAAAVEDIWEMWATEAGLAAVSSESRIDLRPGGDYAWFLDLEPDEQGRRGSEGSTIVSFIHAEELVFDWTFPSVTPGLRAAGATTRVTVRLAPASDDAVAVSLTARGWGDGDEWDRGYEYFDRAWEFVLEKMQEAAESNTWERRTEARNR